MVHKRETPGQFQDNQLKATIVDTRSSTSVGFWSKMFPHKRVNLEYADENCDTWHPGALSAWKMLGNANC
jgi:hypothetical protein